METEAKVPEEESATIFTLIESTTTAEGEQIKFPQNNGNDLNPKYPLVEETSQANIGKTGEISVTGPQELYQNSNKVSAETKKHPEQQPEGHGTEVLKDSNAELMEMETISKSSVMEDEALSTLPNIASIQVERVDESIVDEIQKEAKSAMTDMREQQESERDFAEKEEVPEGFDLHEVRKSCTENVKKDEPQLEAQSLETIVIKNPSLEEETTELNSSNDTEEHENVWESHLGETINATDGEKFINEEAKEMEEITNMQLLKTASKSVLENEATILSTSKFAKGETDDEIFEKKALKEEESAAKENESCVESKLEQATKAVEILPMFKQAIYLPVAVGDFGGHNEEQTDHLSEAQTFQSATTKHFIPEGFMTTERSTKSSYNIEEPGEISDSHTAENSEIKDCGNSLLEPMDMELQKHETKSALEDKAQSDILTTVSHTEEKLEESTREEIHKEVESTVEDTKDKLTSEKNFEKKKKEDFDLHEVTREHEKKEESQPEAQSMETIIIKYQNLEVSTEINPSNDKEILEMTPRSLTEEKAKEIKEATDMQLTESATESVSDNEAQSAVAKSTTLIGEKVDEILQEQTLKEEESAAIDKSDSCTPENQLTQTDKFVEKIGLLETIGKVAALDEEHDNNHSVSPAFESVIKNDTLSEGLVTMESQSSTKFSCDVEELKKNPESHFVEISEHMDIENAAVEEAIYIKEATNFELPNSDRESDKSLSPLPSTEVAGVAMAEKICEEIHMKVESAVTGTEEEQRSENDFEKKKEAPKAINQSAAVGNIFVETKPEGLNQETTAINHQNLVETTKTKTSNSTQEFEIIAPSYTGVKTETEDGGKFIEEQEKDMEEATITQLMKIATESVQGGGAPSILLSSAIIRGETAQEIFPDGCKAENEHEKMAIKDELNQAVNLPIYMAKVNEENEEHCDHQSDVTTWESVITKHTISEGLEEKEISTNSSYDVEQEKILEQTTESLDIANRDKIPPEEAINVKEATEVDLQNSEMESVLEDEALSTLPFTASVEVETVGEPIQEEIHKEGESTVIDAKDTKEGALELQETTTENKKKDDPQLEVSSLQIIDTKLPNLVGETTETKPCNDSETNEEVSALPTRDKQEIKEGGSHRQDEAKVMEEATNMQLLETATESFDDEGPSILPTLSIVKGQTVKEETFLLQILKDERPEATDTTECCTPENNLEQTEKIVEVRQKQRMLKQDIDTHETMGKVGAKNEEHADDESQPSELENVITNNTNSEGMMRTEDSTKASNDVEEQENISVSHSVENSEIKDSSKTLPEQTISMKEAAVDSSKFETESLHDNKALSTLHTVESIGVETVVECIQDQEETHTEGESTVTNTKEGQKPEDDFEEKKEVPEDFELHEPKDNISQSEALSLQTIAIKHLDLGDATETNSFNDYEDELTVPHNSEKLEIMDGGQFILEGEKEKEEAIETQLEESTKEMTGDDEAPSKFPTAAMDKGEVVDEVLQKQTFAEEEPTAIDKDGSSVVENEHEVSAKLVEEIDLTKTKGKDVAENKEQDDHQSKVQSLATQTTKHSNSELTVIMECNTASYEVEEEKILGSHSLDNLEIMDGVKTVPEQAIYNKEATYAELPKSETESLPEDQAMSTLSTTGSVRIETVEESIQEEVHREEESEVRETKVGQRPESDFEEEKKFPEDSDLHKTDNTSVETKTTYEMQSLETIAIEHSNSEAYTREITTSNDTQECEQVLASHTSEKLDIKDKGELILEEGKGKDKGIEIQLEEYAKEMTGVPDDEASSTLPTSAMFKDEKTNETIQELSFTKDDSAVVDTNRSFRQENEHDETSKVVEEHDTPKTIGKVGEDKEQYADYQSEFPILETLITQHTNSDEIVTVEGRTKTRYDLDEQERIPESHSVKKSDVTDGGKALPEESTYVELLKSQTESGPEDKGLSTFPSTAALSVETVEENTQEGMHKEAESSGTDTEERQRPQNDFDEKTKVPEAFDMHEETINNCVETKKEPQFEAQSLETTAADHPASHTEELVINDTEKFILEESKEMEVSTGMQLQESTKEIAKGVIVEEVVQQKTLHEEKSPAKDIDGSRRPENELEQAAEVHEGNDLPEITGKLHYETPTTSEITIAGRLVTTEISTESSYDGEYLVKIPYSQKRSEMMDNGKTLVEEATDVDLQKSETETSAGVDIIEESIHEEADSAETDTEAGHSPENYLVDKKEDFEAFDLHKSTLENEPHLEVQSQETMVIVHPNLEGENRETKLGYDTDDLKQLPVSLTEEKSEIKDKWRFLQEGAKAMEEETVIQLLDSTKGSVTDDEAPSTLPTLALVKAGVIKEIIQEETFKEEESAIIDYDRSYMPENELEQTTTNVEASDLPKIMGKLGAQNEEHTTKHTILEGLETKEISTESNYEGEKMENILDPVDSSQLKGDEKNAPEEATCIKKTTYAELKSETESVPEDQILTTFLTTASVEIKTSKESIRSAIHKQMKSAVSETKEGQQPEIESDKRTNFSEASHLLEVTLENKKIDELHFEEHSQETIVIEDSNLEEDNTEIMPYNDHFKEHSQETIVIEDSNLDEEIIEAKPYNDTEEPEHIRASNTEENLVRKDEEKIIHEEAKVVEETNVMQLPESAEGSIPDDIASSTLPTSAIVKGEKVEDIIQEQTLKEEKSAAIDNDGSCRAENDVEQTTKVIETIDLPEIMGTVGDGNKEPTDYQSEVCTLETAIKEHIISEGLETTEIITESSYYVELLENIPEPHNVDNSMILDGQKIMAEEAICIKEATNLETQNKESISGPEDNALSTLSTIATVRVKTTEESIQDEMHKDAKPAVTLTTTEEKQRSKNDIDDRKEVQKVDLQEETRVNERMHEHQSEVQFLGTKTVLEHQVSGGDAAKAVKIYDTKELEQVPTSHTEKKFENKDGAKVIDEKAIDVEEAINVQLPGSRESVLDNEVPSTLSTSSIVKGETAEEFFQDQTPKIEKSASIDNDGSSKPENEFEQTEKVVQEIDPTETTGKVTAENKEHPDHHSRALSSDTAISKHTTEEGLEAIETSKESSTTFVRVESIEQSIQENICTEAESALADTEEMWRPENDFKEKKTVVEDIDPYEAAAEYVKKDEPQFEAKSNAAMVIKYPNTGGTQETRLSSEIEELQHVPVLDVLDDTQNIKIKEGGKYTQEEAQKIEEASSMQLTHSVKESVADDESLSTLAKYEIVKSETVDESVQEQTFNKETQAVSDNQWSCRPENVLEKTVKVVEEFNVPETKIKVGEENDKDGSHQSEVPALETLITKHAISVELETMEIHTKSSYNVQELENIPESHYVENSKIKDGGKTVPIEVIDINEATDAELEKTKTESMPEGKVLVETIEESIQKEMHEAELTVTDINESQRREYDFEEKTIPKAFDVCKATAENEKKDEPQFEVKSMGTIAIKHATLEGDTAETKPISDTEKQEQGPVSYTAEKSEIQDVGESILEKEKEMDETNDIQLEESSKESKPRDEAPSMFPTSAILKTEMPEEVFHEQTIEEEESATTDNGNSRPENELEQTAKVVEAIDLPETMGKVSVENEEQAKNHSESPINSAGLAQMERSTESSYEVDAPDKIPEYSEGLFKMTSTIERSYEVEALEKIPGSSEGLVKMTSSNESSYEVHALEKISESQSVKNSEIKGCREIPKEETTNAQLSKCETESVPEDKSWSTLPTTASAGAETFEESTQENIHMEDKSALTHTREWQKPDNGLKENKNVPETFDQHQGTSNSSEENKKKDETQSGVQTANTTVTKFDEEMTDKNPNSYIEELVMVQASHSRAGIEIKDGGKFMQEEEKGMEEATCTQLPISSKPSVPNEEALPTMSTLATVKSEREIVKEIFQEQTLKEEESAATDSNGSGTPKNKLEQMKRVVEEVDLPGTKCKLNAENEKHTDHQSEAPTLRNVIKTHTNSDGMVTLDSSTKSSYDVKQEEKSLEAHTFDNSKNKNAGKTSPEEAIYIKEATNVELAKLETESMLEDKSLPTLLTTEAVRAQMVDEQINIQKVTESAVIDTTEEHGPEKDFEENKISQAFNVNGVTRNTCAESKEKNEAQSEVQSQETIVIKHPSMEGTIIETDPNYYTKKLENVPSSSTREILGGKFIQDKEKEHKEATGMQLLKTSPAGVPEALSTLPRSAIVKGETIDEIFEDHTLKEEESAVIDDKKICRPENQIEQTPEVVEAIDLIETMSKVNAQNKEHADFQSEALTSDNVVSKNTISDGMLTTESCIKSSYDVKKLEKFPQSHTAGISEIKDVVKSPHEEAIYVKEATNVELHKPEAESMPYEALSTTITISDRVKTVEECIIHEIHKESKSAVTDDKDGRRQENKFEEKEKIPEAFNLHEETGNAFLEHEKNAEIQCEEHCEETMLISVNNNTAEREKFSALHTGVILEMEEARDVQLPTSKTESAKLDAYEKSDMRESTTMDKSELPEENISIPEPTYPDHEVYDLIKEQLPQTKEKGYNIQDQISESDDHIQGQTPLCEDQIKPEPQMEAEHHLNVPLSAKETSVVGLITIGVQDAVDRAGTIENIQDEKAIDSGNSLEKVQISSTTEETVNQVKDEFNKNFEAKDPDDDDDDDDDDDEQKAKPNLSIKNDPIEKEAAADRDTAEVIESPKEDEGGNEFLKISSSSSGGTVMIEASRDTDVKASPHKKSHGILSGVGSKVKHSISKVKKAITGKSSHPKTQSPK